MTFYFQVEPYVYKRGGTLTSRERNFGGIEEFKILRENMQRKLGEHEINQGGGSRPLLKRSSKPKLTIKTRFIFISFELCLF